MRLPVTHLLDVTVSMRVMSAGDGYKYLLRTVAAADGDRELSTPLTRYYMEAGTPQGSKSSPVLIGFFPRIQRTPSTVYQVSGSSRR